jgi:branched-chain amino acid transport system ATP-binding protein
VVGGLRSLGGALASAALFAALSEVFFRVPALGGYLELVSAVMLGITLLAYPGGLAALGQAGRRLWRTRASRSFRATAPRLPRWRGSLGAARLPAGVRERMSTTVSRLARLAGRLRVRRRPAAEPILDWGGPADAPAPSAVLAAGPSIRLVPASDNGHGSTAASVPRDARRVLLEADDVTVRFGGLTAVRNAGLQVREGEIAGLIGPNGAGKTTLFNAIAGFVTPTEGRIRLFGHDVTFEPVHIRARLGVARTFQAIQLFPQLTVFENLLVATHLQNATGVFAHMVVSSDAIDGEGRARRRVRECLDLLELSHLADRRISDLPFGVLRMVEVARAVVTGFRLMMLDEPASGLDNTETDRLADVVRFVRDLGVSILLIEHDIRMVTSVSDHLYVLEQGAIIAEGPAEAVQHDPAVVAAYLGEPAAVKVGA